MADLFNDWNNFIGSIKRTGKFVSVGAVPKKGESFMYTAIHIDPITYGKMVSDIKKFEAIPSKMRPALEDVGMYLVSEVIPRMFEDEASGSGMWDQLQPSTVKWRSQHGYAEAPILQASGELYAEATSETAIVDIKTGKNARVVIGGQNFKIGNNLEKYFTHMNGGTGWGGSEIPPRPFMPQTDADLTSYQKGKIRMIFQHHINELVGA